MKAARTNKRSEELDMPDLEAFRGIIKGTQCWKAAGPDQIKAFW